MNRLSWLQKIYWAHFGKPVQERALFRQLVKTPISSILEIGVGDCERMQRLARLAQTPDGVDALRYVGTDEFEAATDDKNHVTLKRAHQLAGRLGLKATLIPGDVAAAIPRVAHKVGACDLIIVDGGLDPENPQSGVVGSWMNRLAHDQSIVLACREKGGELVVVDPGLLELPVSRAA